jgi:hypothetical protein
MALRMALLRPVARKTSTTITIRGTQTQVRPIFAESQGDLIVQKVKPM